MNRRIREFILCGMVVILAVSRGFGTGVANPDPCHALTLGAINTINGNITLAETDLAVACPAFDLVFARAYNSVSPASQKARDVTS